MIKSIMIIMKNYMKLEQVYRDIEIMNNVN